MTPALAVHTRLQELGYSNFIWVGHKYNQAQAVETSPEYQIVTKLPHTKFIDLRTGKLVRSWRESWEDFKLFLINFTRIPWGFIKALLILIRYRPQVIISFGGYLAVPIVFWAWILRVPAVTHEQTVVAGLANKIIGRFVQKVLISWPQSAKYYPQDKVVHTGNPIRSELLHPSSSPIPVSDDLPTIYITGGNQGAVVINQAVFQALPDLLTMANVIHQTGSAPVTTTALQNLNIPREVSSRYYHQPYFTSDQVGAILHQADVMVSRAGANIMTEALLLHIPTIFIPIPWVSHNEQLLNAQAAADTGISLVLQEQELTKDTLLQAITHLIQLRQHNQSTTGSSWEQAMAAADNLVVPNATNRVVDEITSIL